MDSRLALHRFHVALLRITDKIGEFTPETFTLLFKVEDQTIDSNGLVKISTNGEFQFIKDDERYKKFRMVQEVAKQSLIEKNNNTCITLKNSLTYVFWELTVY